MPDIIHMAKGAGRWYPAAPAVLRDTVETYIDQAEPPACSGRIAALIAPHAGYLYSGAVAGHAYRAVRDQAQRGQPPNVAVVLGFSHHQAFRGVALLDGGGLQTPLGVAALDPDAGAFLVRRTPHIFFNADRYGDEHSAENQVPFLQVALPETRLIIGLVGDRDPETIVAVSNALDALADETNVLVVASTDLLHDPDWSLVSRTDRETLALMAAMDAEGIRARWCSEHQICCGLAPVLTAMQVARLQGAKQGQVLAYRNSGDDAPETRGQWVVGYGAVAYPC